MAADAPAETTNTDNKHRDTREELRLAGECKCLVATVALLVVVTLVFAILVYVEVRALRLHIDESVSSTAIAADPLAPTAILPSSSAAAADNVSNAIEAFRKRNANTVH